MCTCIQLQLILFTFFPNKFPGNFNFDDFFQGFDDAFQSHGGNGEHSHRRGGSHFNNFGNGRFKFDFDDLFSDFGEDDDGDFDDGDFDDDNDDSFFGSFGNFGGFGFGDDDDDDDDFGFGSNFGERNNKNKHATKYHQDRNGGNGIHKNMRNVHRETTKTFSSSSGK